MLCDSMFAIRSNSLGELPGQTKSWEKQQRTGNHTIVTSRAKKKAVGRALETLHEVLPVGFVSSVDLQQAILDD